MESYCVSLFLCLTLSLWYVSKVMHVIVLTILLLYGIPLYEYIMIYPFYFKMDIQVVLLLEKCCYEHSFTFMVILVHLYVSFFLMYISNSGNGSSWVCISSNLQSNAKLFSKEVTMFYTPTSSVGEFLLLHILAKKKNLVLWDLKTFVNEGIIFISVISNEVSIFS